MGRQRRYYLDVTLRPVEEIGQLRERIAALEEQLARKEVDYRHMTQYATMSLALMDQLREAKRRLEAAGEDTSFIRIRS